MYYKDHQYAFKGPTSRAAGAVEHSPRDPVLCYFLSGLRSSDGKADTLRLVKQAGGPWLLLGVSLERNTIAGNESNAFVQCSVGIVEGLWKWRKQ